MWFRKVAHRKRKELIEQIQAALASAAAELRAAGGAADFVDVQNGIVQVRVSGKLQCAPPTRHPLLLELERRVLAASPHLRGVTFVSTAASPGSQDE